MLCGSEVTLFDGTLIAKTLCAFEEQLHSLAAAQTADWIGITCQVVLLLDDRFTGLASPFVPDENQWPVTSDQWPVKPDCSCWPLVTDHWPLFLHSSALRRTASVVRNRRHVANRAYFNSGRREGAHC